MSSQIKKEITDLTKDVKGRLFNLVETKKGEIAYFILEEQLERAQYFEAKDLITEISNLMKLCTLQFDPMDKKFRKKSKKRDQESYREEIQQTLATTTTKVAAKDFAAIEERRSTVQTILVKFDSQDQEKTPHFETAKELREYKSNQRVKQRARVIKPPKVTENLNNETRNSMTRARLQAFDRQANRPQKRTQITCIDCGFHQKGTTVVFCEFCGKPL